MRLGGRVLGAASALLSGCLSAKYRPAAKDTPPAAALNASGDAPDVSAAVESIVIFHGPGSWKRDAYWDEYIVVLTNRSGAPVTLTSATLVGLSGRTAVPGSEPWPLEKDSRAAAKENFWLPPGSGAQIGAGAAVFGASIGAGAVFGAATSGGFISSGAGAVIGGAVLAIAAVPVVGGGTLVRNATHRREIEHEFDRRRLRLPVTLPAREAMRGSLFFVITPGPRELRLEYRAGGAVREVAVDVTQAGPLHLRRAPSAVAAPPKVEPRTSDIKR